MGGGERSELPACKQAVTASPRVSRGPFIASLPAHRLILHLVPFVAVTFMEPHQAVCVAVIGSGIKPEPLKSCLPTRAGCRLPLCAGNGQKAAMARAKKLEKDKKLAGRLPCLLVLVPPCMHCFAARNGWLVPPCKL